MKKLLSGRLTWVKITESISLIILGILVSVLGGLYHSKFPMALTICLAIFLAIDGLITLVEFWLEPKKNFTISSVLGAIMIAAAVMMIIFATTSADIGVYLAQFISILLIAFGVIFLVKMIIQAIYHGPVGWIIVHTLVFVLATTLGIVSICYSSTSLEIILIVLGIAITVLGVVDLVLTIIAYRKKLEEDAKKGKEKKKKVEVDAEVDDDDKVVVANGKKSKKKITKKKETKPKELAMEEKDETESEKSEDKKDEDNSNEEVVEAEVVDPEK